MCQRSTLGYPRRHISTKAGKRTAVDNATDHKAHRRDLMRWLPGNMKETKCAQSKYEITYDYRNYGPDHCHNSISVSLHAEIRIRCVVKESRISNQILGSPLGPNAINHAIGYAKHRSRSHH